MHYFAIHKKSTDSWERNYIFGLWLFCRQILLYQTDIILKELDTQKQIKIDIQLLFPRVILPTVRRHLWKFGIRFNEEELVI